MGGGQGCPTGGRGGGGLGAPTNPDLATPIGGGGDQPPRLRTSLVVASSMRQYRDLQSFRLVSPFLWGLHVQHCSSCMQFCR